MKSGTYLEYFCARCGFHPMLEITENKEMERHARIILTDKIKKHIEKCPITRDVFSSKLAKDYLTTEKRANSTTPERVADEETRKFEENSKKLEELKNLIPKKKHGKK